MQSRPSDTPTPTPHSFLDTTKFPEVICNTCNKGIEGKIVSALGKTWHPEHFTCSNCKNAIMGDRFNQEKGAPFCEECYALLFLKRCFKCQQPIKEKVVIALEKTWHQEHFTCTECNMELTGTSFFEKEGLPFCQTCHMKKFAPKCHGCTKPITDTAIIALGEKWHQKCFQCSTCHKPVTETTFEVVDNKPLCAACSKAKK